MKIIATNWKMGLLAGAVLTAAGCGSGDWSYKDVPATTVPVADPGATAETVKTCAKTEVWVSANHGHDLTIPQKDFRIGEQVTYSIHGTADHDHLIVITDSEFERMKRGETVSTFTTGGDSHVHTVTIRCVD